MSGEVPAEPGSWQLGPAADGVGQMLAIRLHGERVLHLAVPPQSPWLTLTSLGCGSQRAPRRLCDFLPAVRAWLLELASDPSFLELELASLASSAVQQLLRVRPYVIVALAGPEMSFRLLERGGATCDIQVDLHRCCFLVGATPAGLAGQAPRKSPLRRARLSLDDVMRICAEASLGSGAKGGNGRSSRGGNARSSRGGNGRSSQVVSVGAATYSAASLEEFSDASVLALTGPAPGEPPRRLPARRTRLGGSRLGRNRSARVVPEPPEPASAASSCASRLSERAPAALLAAVLPTAGAAWGADRTPPVASASASWFVDRVSSLTAVLLSGGAPVAAAGAGDAGRGASGQLSLAGSRRYSSERGGLGLSQAKWLRALRLQLWQFGLRVRAATPTERAQWRAAGLVVALLEVLAFGPAVLAQPPQPPPPPAPSYRAAERPERPFRPVLALRALQRDALGQSEWLEEAREEAPAEQPAAAAARELAEAAAKEAAAAEAAAEAAADAFEYEEALEADAAGELPVAGVGSAADGAGERCHGGGRCAWAHLRAAARDAALAAACAALQDDEGTAGGGPGLDAGGAHCVGPAAGRSSTVGGPGVDAAREPAEAARAALAAGAAARSVEQSEARAENSRGDVCACCVLCSCDADEAQRRVSLERRRSAVAAAVEGGEGARLATARGRASLSDVWWLPETLISILVDAKDAPAVCGLAAACSALVCSPGAVALPLLWSIRAWCAALPCFSAALAASGGLAAIADLAVAGSQSVPAAVQAPSRRAADESGTDGEAADPVGSSVRLVAAQILAAAAAEPLARPAVERASPALLEQLRASQALWPHQALPSPCCRAAAMDAISAGQRRPPEEAEPAEAPPAASSRRNSRKGREYLSPAPPQPFAPARAADELPAFLSRVTAQLHACLPHGAVRLSESAAAEASAMVRLTAEYLRRHAHGHSAFQLQRLVVAPLSRLLQLLVGSSATAASPLLERRDGAAVAKLELACAMLGLAHVLRVLGRASPQLAAHWAALFVREAAVTWTHDLASKLLRPAPDLLGSAAAYYGSAAAASRLLGASRAAVAHHLLDLAHAAAAAAASPEGPPLSLPCLWGSAKAYLLPFFAQRALGDVHGATAGGDSARELSRQAGGRCEAALLRLVTLAVDEGAAQDSGAEVAELAEALWRRGVGLYASSEAAFRWRVARGACEPSPTPPDDAPGRTPMPPGLAMRALLAARYLESLGAIAARRGPEVAARLSSLGAARALVAELSLEQQLPTARLSIQTGAPRSRASRASALPSLGAEDESGASEEDEDEDGPFSSSESECDSPPFGRAAPPRQPPPGVPRLSGLGTDSAAPSAVPALRLAGSGAPATQRAGSGASLVPKLSLSFSAAGLAGSPGAQRAAPDASAKSTATGFSSSALSSALSSGRVAPLSASPLTNRFLRPSERPSFASARPTSRLAPPADRSADAPPDPAKPNRHSAYTPLTDQQETLKLGLDSSRNSLARSASRFSLMGGELSHTDYAAERAGRLLYASDELHAALLLLLTHLLVSPSGLSLDSDLADARRVATQSDASSRLSGCAHQSAHLALDAHLSHAANAALAPSLLATASRRGEAYGVLLRLLCAPLLDHGERRPRQTIARGAFGAVCAYEAPDPTPASTLAARRDSTLAARRSSSDPLAHSSPLVAKLLPKAASRFARSNLPEVFVEVLALRRLQPSGVAAQLLAFGCDASCYYLIMPRYEQTLRMWRRDGPAAEGGSATKPLGRVPVSSRPLGQVLALYSQALRAVATLRSLGIEHFDIKADNFLLTRDGAGDGPPGEGASTPGGTRPGAGHAPPAEAAAAGRLASRAGDGATGTGEAADSEQARDVAAVGGLRLVVADLGVARLYAPDDAGCSPRDRGTELIKSPEMLEVIQRSGFQSARGSARGGASARASRVRPAPGVGLSSARGGTVVERHWAVPGACDVWACGCLLYETLTGEYLFEEPDWFRFFLRVTSAEQPLLTRAAAARLPAAHAEALSAFLVRVLERDPRQRMHVTELQQRFGRLRGELLGEGAGG